MLVISKQTKGTSKRSMVGKGLEHLRKQSQQYGYRRRGGHYVNHGRDPVDPHGHPRGTVFNPTLRVRKRGDPEGCTDWP